MLLPRDAFIHVPMLSGKIVEPEQSFFRMSRAKFEEWDQIARENGYEEDWRRTHEEREATRSKALAGRLGDDLWIFAYGSLMWDPKFADIDAAEAARIIATGTGALGSNYEYFNNLSERVALLGIKDDVFEAIRACLPQTREGSSRHA
jgi:hypothetical protein